MVLRLFVIVTLLIVLVVPTVGQTPAPKGSPTPSQLFNEQGLSIEFKVSPLPHEGKATDGVTAGEEARVNFKITSGTTPLTSLRPVVWIDQRHGMQRPEPKECREKVQAFLQTSFARRPTLDLNAYFVLTLNQEPNISVIDPLFGFGGSKLYNLVELPGSGEDWVMSANQERLYVSVPSVNQIAVIDIPTWKSIGTIEAGVKPMRVALQNDGRYLWIGNDGGVALLDTSTLKVVTQIKTGAGNHEIAFTDDDRLAFVSNTQDGTVSIVDMRTLARVRDLKVGAQPAALTFSPLSKAVYVASEADGTISVIDSNKMQIVSTIKTRPGLNAIRVPAEGRFGFALNPAVNTVFVFDLTANRLVHQIPVGPGADQITFTGQFAYVRSSATEFVNMIKLADLGKEAALSRFPAGQKAPKESGTTSLASAIVPAPEEGAVLVANPADKMIYYYTEGMAAPMGSFQNYRRIPKALLVLDNGLRETARGVYSTTIRLDSPGFYDAVFLLDSPRAVHCFDFTVATNPDKPKRKIAALQAEQLTSESPVVNETYTLRFRIIDTDVAKALGNLNDLGVLVFLSPGIWQDRKLARPLADGIYEVSFVPPNPGVYYVHFRIPSMDVPYSQIMPLALEAKKPNAQKENQ
jgi:YVTN family beta-propeller protein